MGYFLKMGVGIVGVGGNCLLWLFFISFSGVSEGLYDDDPDDTPEELLEENEHLDEPVDESEARLRTDAVLEEMEDLDLDELLDVVRILLQVLLCSSSSISPSKQHSSILSRRHVSWRR